MSSLGSDDASAVVQLRAYLAQEGLGPNSKLLPERELCTKLGVSRGELRKALRVLENEGTLWRHVGKGTFVTGEPTDQTPNVAEIAKLTNPSEVMRARLCFEPRIAAEAALYAGQDDIQRMRTCQEQSTAARTWRVYENWDNQLHRVIAESARNEVLLYLFDTLNAIRRAVVWGRLRDKPERPPRDHHSFAEHARIIEAIAQRDRHEAAEAMSSHLKSVGQNLLNVPVAAE